MRALVYSNATIKFVMPFKCCITVAVERDTVIDIYNIHIKNRNHKKLSKKFILRICTSPFQLGRLLFVDASTKKSDLQGLLFYIYRQTGSIGVDPKNFKYVIEL
jgi:hypothetical protein